MFWSGTFHKQLGSPIIYIQQQEDARKHEHRNYSKYILIHNNIDGNPSFAKRYRPHHRLLIRLQWSRLVPEACSILATYDLALYETTDSHHVIGNVQTNKHKITISLLIILSSCGVGCSFCSNETEIWLPLAVNKFPHNHLVLQG